jgi:hypothetical protein
MKLAICGAALLALACLTFDSSARAEEQVVNRRFPSVKAVLDTYGAGVRNSLKAQLAVCDVAYPPPAMTWVALKEEKILLVFAPDKKGVYKKIMSYPIIGASGTAGPKLKEGDKQVPEGFYRVVGFRPNLVAHIGLDVDYPNQFDRKNAAAEKRTDLGSDILIHGSRWSTGCLAMGNWAIEELFVIAYDTGKEKIKLIFAPCNLNKSAPLLPPGRKQPAWLAPLYKSIAAELARYPL